MKIFFRNSVKRTIVLLFLGVFVFLFLHSELGFLDFDGDNHGTHDYCQIVKNTLTHSKVLQKEMPKLELNKNICVYYFDMFALQESQTSFGRVDHHLKSPPSNHLYLFNNTFLI